VDLSTVEVHRLADPLPLIRLLNPKSICFDGLWRRAKFKVIPTRFFRFIVLTYTPINIRTYTHRDKVIAISAPPYYLVGPDEGTKVVQTHIHITSITELSKYCNEQRLAKPYE